MAAGRRPVRELAAAQTPSVGSPAAMTTPQADAPTDHGWVDNHQGLLSCIAGDVRTATTVVACPYYLRHDVLAELPPTARPRWNPDTAPSLTYHGDLYHKITQVAWPHEWRPLVAALPARHAAVPAAWSLFTLLERRPEVTVIDPRPALADRLDNAPETSRSARLIRELLSGLGDTHNRENLLGLTGSAALSPAKLDTGADLDLLVYPPANTGSLDPLLTALGAQFLNELPETDSRLRDYQRSRIMPPLVDHATGLQLQRRRRDVCWIDGLRLDITESTGSTAVVDCLTYQRAPMAAVTVTVEIDNVNAGYPVHITVNSDSADQLLITARGYSAGALRAGDLLRLRCSRHSSEHSPFLSLDDAAGHSIQLLNSEVPC